MKTKILFRTKGFKPLSELEVNVIPVIYKVKQCQFILRNSGIEAGCYFTLDADELLKESDDLNLSICTVFIRKDKFYICFLGNDPSEYFETEEFTIDDIN